MIVDLDQVELDAAAENLRVDAEVLTCAADVSSPDETEAYMSVAANAFGRIDISFNNAGIEGRVAPLIDQDLPQLLRIVAMRLDPDCRAFHRACPAPLRATLDRGEDIVERQIHLVASIDVMPGIDNFGIHWVSPGTGGREPLSLSISKPVTGTAAGLLLSGRVAETQNGVWFCAGSAVSVGRELVWLYRIGRYLENCCSNMIYLLTVIFDV